jgi:hypothetical protein
VRTDAEPAQEERATRKEKKEDRVRNASMADNKRQSIAGKVATPKVGPSKDVSIDGDSILYKAVGARYVSNFL